MKVYTIFILFLQFICVFSRGNYANNVYFFNEYVETVFGINETDGKATISLIAGALDSVEKNVAEKLLANEENNLEMEIDNIVSILKENCQNSALKMNMEKYLTDKPLNVQFLMLLLSFAARLTFTIGGEALEKHGFQIQADSFVFAYKLLETKYRVEEEEFKYRFYHAALFRIANEERSNSAAGLFEFQKYSKNHQEFKDNFEAIYNYLKVSKETVKYFIKQFNLMIRNIENHDSLAYDGIFNYFYLHFHMGIGRHTKENLFSMKNFAVNLGKRILRMKQNNAEAKRYFESSKDVEHKIIEVVKKLEEQLGKSRNDVFKTPYLLENEMLMHFEDAIQIDWRTKEDFTTQAEAMRSFYTKWEGIIRNCKFEKISYFSSRKTLKGNAQEIQKDMENEQNKALFESYDLGKEYQALFERIKKMLNGGINTENPLLTLQQKHSDFKKKVESRIARKLDYE